MSQINMGDLARLVDYKHPLCHEKFPLILFWSPKSGCTTLIKWYFFQLGLVQKEVQEDPHGYFWSEYLPNDYDRQLLIELILEGKKEKYKLVRNPYKRAVSSFLYTLRAGFYHQQPANRLYREYENIKRMNENVNNTVGISFKQFLYYIQKVGARLGTIDFHLAEQYVEGEEAFVNNYIKLENFNGQITELENKYGLIKTPLSEIIRSPHHMSERLTANMKISETIITLEIFEAPLPTYDNFYDRETKDLVREIYQKDFEIYGYNENELV